MLKSIRLLRIVCFVISVLISDFEESMKEEFIKLLYSAGYNDTHDLVKNARNMKVGLVDDTKN